MAIQFPSGVPSGTEFSDAGVLWKYDGEKWVSQSTSGTGGGGETVINYNGASAWGSVNPDGTKEAPGLNYTSTRTGEGAYTITFVTPMPDSQYSVQALAAASAT